jgi:UDP-glucose 4-epimerase
MSLSNDQRDMGKLGRGKTKTLRVEDMPRRVPDISKISALVGFQPTMNLDQIIQSVVDSLRGAVSAGASREP